MAWNWKDGDCDVLVIGGGVSGCWAAIGVACKGAKVVPVEKGNPIRIGCVGSGLISLAGCGCKILQQAVEKN